MPYKFKNSEKNTRNGTLFFNDTMPINHPTNILFISVIEFMYNLRYSEIIPNLHCVKNHFSRFVATAVEMYQILLGKSVVKFL